MSIYRNKLLFILALSVGVLLFSSTVQAEKGVLVFGFDQGDPLGWNPWRQGPPTADAFIMQCVYSGLVRFKPGDVDPAKLEPDLAEKWETSTDGLTWTFHLRKGVKWHGGYGEFTAEDAEYTLTNARDKSYKSKDYAAFKEIKAIDKYTLRIKLENRIPTVLGLVADCHTGYMLSKKAVETLGKDYALKPIGTGPFVFQEYIPNQRTVLVANEDYFRGRPQIKKIIARYMPDKSSREMAFLTGDINIMEGVVEQQWVDKMRATPDTVIDVSGPGNLPTILINMSKKPFDDIRVRKAVCYALDRNELIKFTGKDIAKPLYSVIPPTYLGAIEDVERYDYNPEKAKQLLKEAGYPNGFEIEDVMSEMGIFARTSEIIQAQLRRVGIDWKIRTIQHASYHATIRKDVNHLVLYWTTRFPIADQLLTHFFHSSTIIGKATAYTNFSHYDKIDDLLDKARIEGDKKKQLEYWKKAQQMILEDAAAKPLFIAMDVWARKPWVKYNYDFKASMVFTPVIYYNSEVAQ